MLDKLGLKLNFNQVQFYVSNAGVKEITKSINTDVYLVEKTYSEIGCKGDGAFGYASKFYFIEFSIPKILFSKIDQMKFKNAPEYVTLLSKEENVAFLECNHYDTKETRYVSIKITAEIPLLLLECVDTIGIRDEI